MGKELINEPFAVINADDFYGRDGFAVLGKALTEMAGKQNDYCMVGYHIGNTLSESGTVNRGICTTDSENYLTTVVERKGIAAETEGIVFVDENNKKHCLDANTPVSMNMWGFTPDYFQYSENYFIDFLKEQGQEMKSEFYIPTMVNHLINNGTAKVKVLDTTSSWFGVTYAEDRPDVVTKLQSLVDAGEYPTPLFK